MSALKKKRKRRRLKDIQSFEVAIVPRGANQSRFVVTKEDSMKFDLNKLAEAHASIGKIIKVCKAGSLTDAALSTLGEDLNKVQAALATIGGDKGGTIVVDGAFDPVGLKTRIADIRQTAEQLDAESGTDLNLQDKVDKLLELVADTEAQIEKITVASADTSQEVDEEEESEESEESSEEGSEESEGDGESEESEESEESSEEASSEEESSEESGDEESEESSSSEESASEEGSSEAVTKADLMAFGKELAGGFKEAIGELATTLKAAPPKKAKTQKAAPRLVPPAAAQTDIQANRQSTESEGKIWGNHFDLNAEN